MAKAIITIEDGKEDGQISVEIDFYPPVSEDIPGTHAQFAALEMLKLFQKGSDIFDTDNNL